MRGPSVTPFDAVGACPVHDRTQAYPSCLLESAHEPLRLPRHRHRSDHRGARGDIRDRPRDGRHADVHAGGHPRDGEGRDPRPAARRSARRSCSPTRTTSSCVPAADVVRDAGGLHRFMGWDRPILTDSGGFQVFSLADTRQAHRRRRGLPLASSTARGTSGRPRTTCAIQEALGADIIMQLDQCPPYPAERRRVAEAVVARAEWAGRCAGGAHAASDQALFGIVQGGVFADLRAESVARLVRDRLPGLRHRRVLGGGAARSHAGDRSRR